MHNQTIAELGRHARYREFSVDLPFVRDMISKNVPPLVNSNIKKGQRCWAVCKGKLFAAHKFSDETYEGIGRWKNKINIDDLILVQTIKD